MNPPASLRLLLVVAAFLLPRWVRAENSDIRVDVVVDLTDAGRQVARPTFESPAYYLPLTVGYKEEGAFVPDQVAPPTLEVQHQLAQALYDQGYRVTNPQQPPSVVLVFWWGHLAPETNSTEIGAPLTHTSVGNTAHGGGFNGEDPRALMAELPTDQSSNERQMISLVAGNTRDYQYATENPNPKLEQIIAMEKSPRHFLIVSAFDFKDWSHHQTTLLWQAHLSTELAGNSLGQVLPVLLAIGAPYFGRETKAPELIAAPFSPMATVILGTAVVKDYPQSIRPPTNMTPHPELSGPH